MIVRACVVVATLAIVVYLLQGHDNAVVHSHSVNDKPTEQKKMTTPSHPAVVLQPLAEQSGVCIFLHGTSLRYEIYPILLPPT
jgi:hypothetical protein